LSAGDEKRATGSGPQLAMNDVKLPGGGTNDAHRVLDSEAAAGHQNGERLVHQGGKVQGGRRGNAASGVRPPGRLAWTLPSAEESQKRDA
jgi:glycine/D-amino acid oxidase-like deaminating enzyme